MTLTELEQVKKDLADGVIVSRGTWERLLEQAMNPHDDTERLNFLEKNNWQHGLLDFYVWECRTGANLRECIDKAMEEE